MYAQFTDRARKVMQLAGEEAQHFNREYIGTEHLLLALAREGAGIAGNVLKDFGLEARRIRPEIEKLVEVGLKKPSSETLRESDRLKQVILYSLEEAQSLNHQYVGTEHLLLGLLREQEGRAKQVLANLGLNPAELRQEVLNLLGHGLG